jgi:hypothetical protein
MRPNRATLLATSIALMVLGCGNSSTKPSSTQTVAASGGATLSAGMATLTIQPGALAHDTTVTLREADPHHRAHD